MILCFLLFFVKLLFLEKNKFEKKKYWKTETIDYVALGQKVKPNKDHRCLGLFFLLAKKHVF